jgi:1-acyl-sn-glycerol-3-phosphate acyltransferase
MKWIAKLILWMAGWKIVGDIPKEARRSVMVGAPHTTNWDYLFTRASMLALGIPMRIAIKDFWTKFPFGLIIKPLGGIGIDRSGAKSQVRAMADLFKKYEDIALVITPEGTRSLREHWKLGFYYIAKTAGVPITFGWLDYKNKVAGIGGPVYLTEDMGEDIKKVMEFYVNINPKYPEKFSVDKRFYPNVTYHRKEINKTG